MCGNVDIIISNFPVAMVTDCIFLFFICIFAELSEKNTSAFGLCVLTLSFHFISILYNQIAVVAYRWLSLEHYES